MVNLIWAMDKNRLIGSNNDLPWHYSSDLKYFKKITSNKTVLMGRKTFDSIFTRLGKPLPNRKNIILTSSKSYDIEDCETISDFDTFITNNNDEIFVIGGKSVYEQTLKYAHKLYITFVDKEYKGDCYFPKFDLNNFELESEIKEGELRFCVFRRKI